MDKESHTGGMGDGGGHLLPLTVKQLREKIVAPLALFCQHCLHVISPFAELFNEEA